eukprot:Platyproteum_vivax@DN3175_c0_g1_i1.p1
MVPTYISLIFLLSAVLVNAGYGRSPKRMEAELISPNSIYEGGKDFLVVNFTMPDNITDIPTGEGMIFRVNCWGLFMASPSRTYPRQDKPAGPTSYIYKMWFDVVGNHGPTKCEVHIEYKNVIYYRAYGDWRLGIDMDKRTGFPGPDILPKPAETVWAKYLGLETYNVQAGATQVVKIGMQHHARFIKAGELGFNVTFPGDWKVNCDPIFKGADIVENYVTYKGMEYPTLILCDAEENQETHVVSMAFRDLFPEPTDSNGLYFSIGVTLPEKVEGDLKVLLNSEIQFYTENEPYKLPALKQQG